ncbi:MAG: YaaA family protein [Collinsella sp.]|nr:YaaA family protein [Collinsella sp.]
MLQVIISPAKQMRAVQDAFEVLGIPPFVRETARLHRALLDIERNEGRAGLQALWNVSDRLLTTCLDTLHEFMPVLSDTDLADPDIARRISPAIMSYHGIQYQSMAPEVMDAAQLAWLQDHLWILSGLYGCIRPFHAVEPYRLEMGAKLAVDDARDLYAFWSDKLARAIAPAGSNTTIVNLASVEYAKAVLPHLAGDATAVTCLFGEGIRNGKPIQRSTASKKARGSMVRWMAENKVEDAGRLTEFNIGYRHAPELSCPGTLVFINEQML